MRFAQNVEGALGLIANAAQQAKQAQEIEVLRIHASPTFASAWLMPRLPDFRAKHPDIRVELSASHQSSDFSRADVDLDIRYGPASWEGLEVKTLFTERVIPMISPRLKEKMHIRCPQDLVDQELIFSTINIVKWPTWFAAFGVTNTPRTYALSFDRAYMVIDAAVQGLGIALDSHRMAESALKCGKLVPVFDDGKGIEVHAHHLVYPQHHGKWTRVAKFTEWLHNEANS